MPCQESSDVEEFTHTHTSSSCRVATCYMLHATMRRRTLAHVPEHTGLGVIPADPWAILLARAASAGPHAGWEEKSGRGRRAAKSWGDVHLSNALCLH
jgi:hypothetical protein